MTEHEETAAEVAEVRARKTYRLLQPLWITSLIAVALNVAFFSWIVFLKPAPYKPLGDYPVQSVGLDPEQFPPGVFGEEASKYPAVHVSADSWPFVPVSGTKCANETTRVAGVLYWHNEEPPGFLYTREGSVTDRVAGCTSFRFENPIPDEVRTQVEVLASQGTQDTLWKISGKEVPYKPDGTAGNPATYTSDLFAIVWDG